MPHWLREGETSVEDKDSHVIQERNEIVIWEGTGIESDSLQLKFIIL